jgi:hypothetical protein
VGNPLLISYNLPNVNQSGLVIPKITMQLEAVLVLDDGAHHCVFNLAVIEIVTRILPPARKCRSGCYWLGTSRSCFFFWLWLESFLQLAGFLDLGRTP